MLWRINPQDNLMPFDIFTGSLISIYLLFIMMLSAINPGIKKTPVLILSTNHFFNHATIHHTDINS